jgi:hypothetical protein
MCEKSNRKRIIAMGKKVIIIRRDKLIMKEK